MPGPTLQVHHPQIEWDSQPWCLLVLLLESRSVPRKMDKHERIQNGRQAKKKRLGDDTDASRYTAARGIESNMFILYWVEH